MVTQEIGTAAVATSGFSTGGARDWGASQQKALSVQVPARVEPVTQLAALHQVSRKFLYQQASRASAALDDAFEQSQDDQAVLFHLPVTKDRIRQFIVGLALEGHSSFRGIRQLAADLPDWPVSLGTIHNVIAAAAEQFAVPTFLVGQLCQLEGRDDTTAGYWQCRGVLLTKLGAKFDPLQQAVRAAMDELTRASSLVENLNSRLRNYFFLRRDLGDGYLDLLRFFLNHRRFQRSRCAERAGRSPAELLTGQSQAHWLELLGFQRFHRPARAAA